MSPSDPVASARTPAQVEGDSPLQTELLEELSDAVRYRKWLVSLALPHVGDRPLEIGSGNGDYAAEFSAHGVRIAASEADSSRLGQLRHRFDGDPRVDVLEIVLPVRERGDYSAVVSYNVLEHISDHVGALRSMGELVRPGGAVIALVPAFMVAFSRLDERIGHQRRYRKGDLASACEQAGLRVERIHYVNSLGLLAWIVGMRLLRLEPHSGRLLTFWDGVVIRMLRRIESVWRPPFGQSVFVIARTPLAGPGQ